MDYNWQKHAPVTLNRNILYLSCRFHAFEVTKIFSIDRVLGFPILISQNWFPRSGRLTVSDLFNVTRFMMTS